MKALSGKFKTDSTLFPASTAVESISLGSVTASASGRYRAGGSIVEFSEQFNNVPAIRVETHDERNYVYTGKADSVRGYFERISAGESAGHVWSDIRNDKSIESINATDVEDFTFEQPVSTPELDEIISKLQSALEVAETLRSAK